MKERSLVLVKPDAVIDEKDVEIKTFLILSDMKITREKKIKLTTETLKVFYRHINNKERFNKIIKLFSRGFAVLIVFEGENAITVGQMAKDFFRKKYNYGYYGCTLHSPDSTEEYEGEIKCLSDKLNKT